MSDGEYNFLENFIQNTDGDILEIGQGFSTILMLYATAGTSRKITSVDVQHKIKDYIQYLPLHLLISSSLKYFMSSTACFLNLISFLHL